MGKYIQQADMQNAMGAAFLIGCFDDAGNGVTTDPVLMGAVASVILRAEGLVDAYLITEIKLPLATAADRLVIEACLEFSIAFAFDRRPEYARRFGGEDGGPGGRESHYKRARNLMLDIKSAQIELPDNENLEPQGNAPGSLLTDHSHRIMVDNACGPFRSNSGDF